jgi:hypothetical protein
VAGWARGRASGENRKLLRVTAGWWEGEEPRVPGRGEAGLDQVKLVFLTPGGCLLRGSRERMLETDAGSSVSAALGNISKSSLSSFVNAQTGY